MAGHGHEESKAVRASFDGRAAKPKLDVGTLRWLANDAREYAAWLRRVRMVYPNETPAAAELRVHETARQFEVLGASLDLTARETEEAQAGTVDEAWQHAACLSIAEGAPGWDRPSANDSPAMRAVRELRARLEPARSTADLGDPPGIDPGREGSRTDPGRPFAPWLVEEVDGLPTPIVLGTAAELDALAREEGRFWLGVDGPIRDALIAGTPVLLTPKRSPSDARLDDLAGRADAAAMDLEAALNLAREAQRLADALRERVADLDARVIRLEANRALR